MYRKLPRKKVCRELCCSISDPRISADALKLCRRLTAPTLSETRRIALSSPMRSIFVNRMNVCGKRLRAARAEEIPRETEVIEIGSKEEIIVKVKVKIGSKKRTEGRTKPKAAFS